MCGSGGGRILSQFVESPGVPGVRRSEIRFTVFPKPRCPWGSSFRVTNFTEPRCLWGSSKRNLTSPEPRTHWEGCTTRPSKAASPVSRTTSGAGSVTPPLKTGSIHSEIVFYIRSSPRNRLVLYTFTLHIFQRGRRDRRSCT